MVHSRMIAESKKLQDKIISLQKDIDAYPEGSISCTRNGQYYKWYKTLDNSRTYISKANRHVAEQLAQKKYLQCILMDLKQEKKAIDSYLIQHNQSKCFVDDLLIVHPEYSTLISSQLNSLSQEIEEWLLAPYDKNPLHPEQLLHKISENQFVRSKSELMIATTLQSHNVPFRYESPLVLDSTIIYPDFTIRHPQTGSFFYWEHFGMMDQSSYCKSSISKLDLYTSHGILPGISLITTYETKIHPLSTDYVEELIDFYFFR